MTLLPMIFPLKIRYLSNRALSWCRFLFFAARALHCRRNRKTWKMRISLSTSFATGAEISPSKSWPGRRRSRYRYVCCTPPRKGIGHNIHAKLNFRYPDGMEHSQALGTQSAFEYRTEIEGRWWAFCWGRRQSKILCVFVYVCVVVNGMNWEASLSVPYIITSGLGALNLTRHGAWINPSTSLSSPGGGAIVTGTPGPRVYPCQRVWRSTTTHTTESKERSETAL